MTPTTNARITGFTFLFYIVVGIATPKPMWPIVDLRIRPPSTCSVHLTIVLGLLQAVCAIVLAKTQISQMLAVIFRVGEGLLGAISTRATLELLWLGTSAGPKAPDAATRQALGTYLLNGPDRNMSEILFAMGSTLFSYLLLRGRTVPVPLAWTSLLLVVGLPL